MKIYEVSLTRLIRQELRIAVAAENEAELKKLLPEIYKERIDGFAYAHRWYETFGFAEPTEGYHHVVKEIGEDLSEEDLANYPPLIVL
jgi:hypothetical protein